MIVRHSLKILEQLSEIEKIIQKLEKKMAESRVEVDREKVLRELLENSQRK